MQNDEYTLIKVGDYRELRRNGKPQFCPYSRGAITVPGQFNQMQVAMTNFNCSDSCPLFSFETKNKVRLNCTYTRHLIQLTEEEGKAGDNGNLIIHRDIQP
jgi:hypothetical protein